MTDTARIVSECDPMCPVRYEMNLGQGHRSTPLCPSRDINQTTTYRSSIDGIDAFDGSSLDVERLGQVRQQYVEAACSALVE